MKKILLICHGNICRSPMAEFVMKDLVEAYYAAFYRGKAGYASAASLLMTVFIALAALAYTLLRRARAGKGAAV